MDSDPETQPSVSAQHRAARLIADSDSGAEQAEADDLDLFGSESDGEHKDVLENAQNSILNDENYLQSSRLIEQYSDEDLEMENSTYQEVDSHREPNNQLITSESVQIPAPGGPESGESLFLFKLPPFMAIDPHPFDRTQPLPQSTLKNVIRWRYEANRQRASNARLVRWSDDSFSLMLGQEFFSVQTKQLPASQHQYLLHAHPEERVFKTQARFQSTMKFQPSSMSSDTHREYTKSIKENNIKINRAKLYSSFENPEFGSIEAARAENERMKARKRLELKQRQFLNRTLDEQDLGGGRSDDDQEPENSARRPNYNYESSDEEVDDGNLSLTQHILWIVTRSVHGTIGCS